MIFTLGPMGQLKKGRYARFQVGEKTVTGLITKTTKYTVTLQIGEEKQTFEAHPGMDVWFRHSDGALALFQVAFDNLPGGQS